ncbi:MAG: Gfo/Idh/MocA family oxidoreductase [Puniceicoccales bacterium]|jgi:predicted dehydrogenase|nr:Gfo/Idh/MocA family oxidoreductase [Puniceicoccales bacterium]
MTSSTQTTRASSRRDFLKTAGIASGLLILPSGFLRGENAPSNRLNVAGVGLGGQGNTDLRGVDKAGATIFALCDVDSKRLHGSHGRFTDAQVFEDYRKMFDKIGKDLDAVIVSTGDHNHFTVALDAIQRGKHVYVQKPMCQTIDQVRRLSKAAKDAKIISSMGNQGHSSNHIRMVKEWYEAGFFGEIPVVDAWDGQYMPAPKQYAAPSPQPQNLNWDLWLGPAKSRPYFNVGNWRATIEFGSGSLGDMGAHIIDPAYYILDLDAPEKIEILERKDFSDIGHASHAKLVYHFPAKGKRGPVKLIWRHGRNFRPAPPEGLKYQGYRENDENTPDNPTLNLHPGVAPGAGLVRKREDGLTLNGSFLRGEKFTGYLGQYGDFFYTAPDEKFAELKAKEPPRKYPRFKGGHYKDWVNAIRENRQAVSDFSYAGPLTEAIIMGNIALRLGRDLSWNAKEGKFINDDEANALITAPKPRDGFHA